MFELAPIHINGRFRMSFETTNICRLVACAHNHNCGKQDEVEFISGQWTSLLRTGGMADTLYPVDESTILISITDGKFMDEVCSVFVYACFWTESYDSSGKLHMRLN